MTDNNGFIERSRSWLTVAATAGMIVFNVLSVTGRINAVTPEMVSAKYHSLVTPASYAFTIWTLIYAGLAAFTLFQLRTAESTKLNKVRTLYILSCVLNCGWIFMWHREQILGCFILILILLCTLLLIAVRVQAASNMKEYWFIKVPFELYGGWVVIAAAANFGALLSYFGAGLSSPAVMWTSIAAIFIATGAAIVMRAFLRNFIFPLATAWGAAAVGIGQSGHTVMVVVSALALIACLIASLSVVVELPSRPAIEG